MENNHVITKEDEPLDLSLNHSTEKEESELENVNISENNSSSDSYGNGATTDEGSSSIDKFRIGNDDAEDELIVDADTNQENNPSSVIGQTSPAFSDPTLSFDPQEADDIDISIKVDGVTATLQEPSLWRDFHQLGTEMIINRCGRRMFPHIVIKFSDIEPSSMYKLMLEITQADDRRYKYVNNRWSPMGMADPGMKNPPFYHTDGLVRGSSLIENRISFAKIKLTNNRESTDGNVVLHSMHKYIPKITLMKMKDKNKDIEKQYVFSFPETVFIAVTAYQNDQITKLKIHNNPFAKAFRDSRSGNQKSNIPENGSNKRKNDRKGSPPSKKINRGLLDKSLTDTEVSPHYPMSSWKPCCRTSCSPGAHCSFGFPSAVGAESGHISYPDRTHLLSQFYPGTSFLSHDIRNKIPQLPYWFPYFPVFRQELTPSVHDFSRQGKHLQDINKTDASSESENETVK